MKTYKVIIAGSRKFSDYGKLKMNCDNILHDKLEDAETDIVIVSGGAHGADNLGEIYASERGLQLDRHPADWEKYGKAAGIIRNKEMAESADALIAFPKEGEENRGTKNMIDVAKKRQLVVSVVL